YLKQRQKDAIERKRQQEQEAKDKEEQEKRRKEEEEKNKREEQEAAIAAAAEAAAQEEAAKKKEEAEKRKKAEQKARENATNMYRLGGMPLLFTDENKTLFDNLSMLVDLRNCNGAEKVDFWINVFWDSKIVNAQNGKIFAGYAFKKNPGVLGWSPMDVLIAFRPSAEQSDNLTISAKFDLCYIKSGQLHPDGKTPHDSAHFINIVYHLFHNHKPGEYDLQIPKLGFLAEILFTLQLYQSLYQDRDKEDGFSNFRKSYKLMQDKNWEGELTRQTLELARKRNVLQLSQEDEQYLEQKVATL